MPNWCSGIMRVKGKDSDIVKFLKEGLKKPDPKDSSKLLPSKVTADGDWIVVENAQDYWIEGTRRMFVDTPEIDYYADDSIDGEDENYCLFDCMQAWALEPDDFLMLSKKWNLDFKMIAFEQGMMFEQTVECCRGWKEAKETSKGYKTTEDWMWNCACPTTGG